MQTVYGMYQDVAFAGLLADSGFTDKVSYSAEGTVPFGGAVQLGTNPERQVKTALTGAAVVGIAIKDHNVEQPNVFNTPNGPGSYAPTTSVSVLKRGRIWVNTEDAVVAGSVARLVTASGKFTDAAAGVGTEELTMVSARFITSTTGAGLAQLEVNPK